jgi:hypothetical protein
VGVGAVVLPGRVIGRDAVVGAGAVLTHDAASGQIHVGVPARPVHAVPDDQMLERQGWVDVESGPARMTGSERPGGPPWLGGIGEAAVNGTESATTPGPDIA